MHTTTQSCCMNSMYTIVDIGRMILKLSDILEVSGLTSVCEGSGRSGWRVYHHASDDEKIMTEQLLNTMPVELQVWVGEWKPTSAIETGQPANGHVQVGHIVQELNKEAQRKPSEKY